MLDFSHIPTPYGAATVEYFQGTMVNTATEITWAKPRGKSMCNILLVANGGNGGTGVIGAAGGGGGGGGSGGQTSITIPLWAIPDILYLRLQGGGTNNSHVAIAPGLVANNTLVSASNGGVGGNAATTTAGTAGTAGIVASIGNMPLGWQWVDTVIPGQAGTAGGAGTTTGTTPTALTLPTNGLFVTGGTGGGACPTTVGAGRAGGAITGAGVFPGVAGGTLGTLTTPPGNGGNGFKPRGDLLYHYGGIGGGGVGSNATGAGLVQSRGGNGMPGCGGGGMGGAFTGSTAGAIGLGGPAFCIITCW
jgi:hypothetical protein